MKNRKPLNIFVAVIYALFLRELDMRFTSGRTGLFWTFFEPFFQIMVFVGIKIALFGGRNNGFDFAVFLALNFIAFNMFKNIVTRSQNAFQANKALFVYKQVKPIDTIIARTFVEIFITLIILVIFIVIGSYLGYDVRADNLNMVVLAFVFLAFGSFSFAVFLAVSNHFFMSIGKIMGFVMMALMFGSAIFYTASMLPPEAKKILSVNPLIHFMEMIHGYFFSALNDDYVNYPYMIFWSFGLLYIGLWLYIKLEKRIISE